MTSTTFIYGLEDPRSKSVRYVGKSNAPHIRLRNHLTPFGLQARSYKNHWLRKLSEQGLKPSLVILEEIPTSRWQERERFWIKQYGLTQLTNTTDGGDGPRRITKRARRNMSLAKKGKKHTRRTLSQLAAVEAARGRSRPRSALRGILAANDARTIKVALNGESLTLKDLSKRSGIPVATIRHRLSVGWGIEKTLTTPLRSKGVWINGVFKTALQWSLHFGVSSKTFRSRVKDGKITATGVTRCD